MFTILINFIDHLLKPCPKFYFYHVYRDKLMYCKLEIYYTRVIVSQVFFSFFWTWNCILLRITSLISNFSIFLQESQSCMEKAKQRASEYLSQQVNKITEVFHLAITSYALSLSSVRSRAVFDSLWKHVRTSMYLLNLYIGIKQSFLCYKWYKLFKTKITKRWVFSTSQ